MGTRTTRPCCDARISTPGPSASIARVLSCLQPAKIFVGYVIPIIYAKTRKLSDVNVIKSTDSWTRWTIGVSEKKAETMMENKMMTLTEPRYGIGLL